MHRTCSSSSVSCGQNGHEVSAPGLKRNLWALIHDTPALNLSNASLKCPFFEHMYSSITKFCFMSFYSKNLSLDSSLSCQLCPKQSFKRWEKVLRNFFSSPTPWLYHTSPNPCISSSSFTLAAQDSFPFSSRFWEHRYAPKGSRSWFGFRSVSQYFMLRVWELTASGYLPLSPYTIMLGVLLFNFLMANSSVALQVQSQTKLIKSWRAERSVRLHVTVNCVQVRERERG